MLEVPSQFGYRPSEGPGQPASLSLGEGDRPRCGELHQRSRTLQLGVVDQLRRVELALVEADRADEEAPSLFDELLVEPCSGWVLVGPDAVGVAVEPEPHAIRGQP